METIFTRIEKAKLSKLTKSQKKLVDYLEKSDYNELMYFSITELSEATGVAEATILRFCRLLGFTGFQAFKLSLAQECGNDVSQTTNGASFYHAVLGGCKGVLDSCCDNLKDEDLNRLYDMILGARRITVFGVGDSYLAALGLHNQLLRMGIVSSCEKDAHIQNIFISSGSKEDLMIIFSVSGSTKDVMEAALLAMQVEMKIVLITSHTRSPLSKIADLVMFTGTKERTAELGVSYSRMVQDFLILVISEGLRLRDKERFNVLIGKSRASTMEKLI